MKLTIDYIIALTVADVDLCLLQNKDQTGDNDKDCFTKDEIRKQLKENVTKLSSVLESQGYEVKKEVVATGIPSIHE